MAGIFIVALHYAAMEDPGIPSGDSIGATINITYAMLRKNFESLVVVALRARFRRNEATAKIFMCALIDRSVAVYELWLRRSWASIGLVWPISAHIVSMLAPPL